jgi:hypothetical protein
LKIYSASKLLLNQSLQYQRFNEQTTIEIPGADATFYQGSFQRR